MMSGKFVWLPVSVYSNLNYLIIGTRNFLKCFIILIGAS
jgi:hypothetical protein